MKVWYGYGSEHSMNLVLIGKFKEIRQAEEAMQIIERITEQVTVDESAGLIEVGQHTERYSEEMLELLRDIDFFYVAPGELEQFVYDARVNVENDKLIVTTDEAEVSAFLKVMLIKGAKVEVYSAHEYRGTGYGRG